MKLKELMLNNKKVCISVISGIVVIIVLIAAIVIKISSVNNSGQNDKAVALNNQSSETISDNKTKEMMSDKNMTTKDSNLADSAETVESDTEKSDENVMEEAKAEENNAAENNNLSGDNSGNNLQQEYNEPEAEAPATPAPEPQPEPDPIPAPEPKPEPKPNPEPEVVEDHVVYKPDGSIDLNESYWANREDASKAIWESSELDDFQKNIMTKYNWTNGSITNMGWSGKNNKWDVYSYSYLIREKGSSNNIKFEFNGKEFVEK